MSSREASVAHDEEIRRAAEIKEWLEEKIRDLELEVARMKEMMTIVDSILRKTSFVLAAKLQAVPQQASSVNRITKEQETTKKESTSSEPRPVQRSKILGTYAQKTSLETRALRRSKDGILLANAYIAQDRVDIVPSSDVVLSSATPPFLSFFVNRILKGYETKDKESMDSGRLSKDELLQYGVEEKDGRIIKVTILNFRDNSRLNEILSTVTWAFTRMLEKK